MSDNECCWDGILDLFSMRKWRMWFNRRECAQSCDLPLSFYKCRFIGISLAIALMPSNSDILNIPNIYKVALLCSFLMFLMGKIVGLYCKTTFKDCIERLVEHNFYREVVSVENLGLSLNYWESSCIWPLISLCWYRSWCDCGTEVFCQRWNLGISRYLSQTLFSLYLHNQ